jgi:MFS superfamily sulfate permease-like transporter
MAWSVQAWSPSCSSFSTGLLADLLTALVAVVIITALSLMDLDVLRRYAQVRTSALTVSLVAAVGVIVLGVLQGIIVAILLAILLPPCHPRSFAETGGPTAVSRRGARVGGWYCTARYPGATHLSGLVVFRWEAPRFFANSGQFRDKVRRLARERPRPGSFCSARWSLTSMSMRSTMRPRTTLCRPMKGCRLHEHRP